MQRPILLLAAAFVLFLSVSGCSIPKIIVLHDPLSAEEHIRLGSIYESQGKPDLAREQYRAAAAQDPKHAKAWALLGDLAFRLNDLMQAEQAYGKALDLDPGSGDLHNNLAWVYAQQNRNLGKARKLVTRALELNPDNRPYYLDTLGVVLMKSGAVEAAIEALEVSVATIPPEQNEFLAEAYRHLADAYAASGDQERADAARAHHRRLQHGTASDSAPGP